MTDYGDNDDSTVPPTGGYAGVLPQGAAHQHTVNESADKIRAKTKIKRGSDVRNQDEIEVVVKGNDPEEVVGMLDDTIDRLRNTAEDARAIQPGEAPDP